MSAGRRMSHSAREIGSASMDSSREASDSSRFLVDAIEESSITRLWLIYSMRALSTSIASRLLFQRVSALAAGHFRRRALGIGQAPSSRIEIPEASYWRQQAFIDENGRLCRGQKVELSALNVAPF